MAVGSIGLSFDDFCALSPREFREIHRAYMERETERLHGEWERIRTLATISVQPYLNKRVDAKKLLPFPWDKRRASEVPKSTPERRRELAEKYKDL